MSGIFRTAVIKTDKETALNELKAQNVPIVVADMNGKNVFGGERHSSFCLVAGNEGNGISDFFMNAADEVISVPMQNGIESLNVAVATGVILYALVYGL